MIPVDIKRHKWPGTCTPERLAVGLRIVKIMEGITIPDDSPLSIVVQIRPWAENLYKGLRMMKVKDYDLDENFLFVPSPMRRHKNQKHLDRQTRIKIPRPSKINPLALKRFLKASDEHLIRELARLAGEAEGTILDMTHGQLFEALEAVDVVSGFPPCLMTLVNFITDFAQPEGTSITGNRRSKAPKSEHPGYAQWRKAVAKKEKPGDLKYASLDDKALVEIGRFFAEDYLANPDQYRKTFSKELGLAAPARAKSTKWDSDKALLQILPSAFRVFTTGDITGVDMDGLLQHALLIIWSSDVVDPRPDFELLVRQPRDKYAAERKIPTPGAIRMQFGLHSTYPELPTSLQGEWLPCAARVLAIILVEGWQRHCSLLHLELQHIIPAPSLGVYIKQSKTGYVDTVLPAWALLPPEDLEYLRQFQQIALAVGYPPATRLFELAGIDLEQKYAQIYKSFRDRVASQSNTPITSTHIARATGLSWAPIRALLSHYPELLNSRHLDEVRDHYWFSPQGLDGMRALVPGESSHSAEVFRRIACWATPTELFLSYCRTWPLLIALHQERLGLNP